MTNHEHDEELPSKHDQLIEEIAARVESKLAAKFAKWIAANFVALIVVVAGGIAAVYDVKHDAKKALDHDSEQDSRIVDSALETRDAREALDRKLDNMAAKIDEINRFLRDHNQATINGFNYRNNK